VTGIVEKSLPLIECENWCLFFSFFDKMAKAAMENKKNFVALALLDNHCRNIFQES
jgi:hypothetical protein